MPISFATQKIQSSSKSLYQNWFPQLGFSLDWAGMTCCLQLQPEGLSVGVDEAAKTKLQRLKLLPRSSFYFRIHNFGIVGRSAPLPETLSNLRGKGLSWNQVKEVASQQLKEIKSPEQVWTKINKTPLRAAKKPQLTTQTGS